MVSQRHCGNHRRMARASATGFTLVELLVVIGIIALLISILLPSLSKARESANTVKCLANLRSLGQAINLYASDNKGCIVPAGYLETPANANGNINDNYATLLIVSGYLTAPILPAVTGGASEKASVFFCPNGLTDAISVYYGSSGTAKPMPPTRKDGLGARPWRASSFLQTGLIVDTWYGINANWGPGVSSCAAPAQVQPDTSIGSGFYAYRKLGSVPYAADMVCLFDGTFYDLNYDANRINARHNRQTTTNLLFFDAHAESVLTNTLPGGDLQANGTLGAGSAGVPFNSLTGLASYARPKWRVDQP